MEPWVALFLTCPVGLSQSTQAHGPPLVVPWSGLHAPNTEGIDSIPGRATEIPQGAATKPNFDLHSEATCPP